MREHINLAADDGHSFQGYCSTPHNEVVKGGVLVVQEIFGVNNYIKEVCHKLSKTGYIAIAPCLFDRHKPAVTLGYNSDSIAKGRAIKDAIGWKNPILDIEAGLQAFEQINSNDLKIGVLGFCWGGTLAWLAACRLQIDCAVSYYGGQISDFINESPRCPTLMHFGANDHGIPSSVPETIQDLYRDINVHVYEGAGHGFSCNHRDDYHSISAELALARTNCYFKINLG